MISKRKTTHKILSVLLTLTLVLSLFVAMPLTASAATGTLYIAGDDFDLAVSSSGTGWSWTASNSTLTLGGSYTGERISIHCNSGDVVNLAYSGNVYVDSILSWAGLKISGSGTLNLGNDDDTGIYADENITISGGTINIATEDMGMYTEDGDVTISGGSVNIETGDKGIQANHGKVTISGGMLNITTDTEGILSVGIVTVSGGTVSIKAAEDYGEGYGCSGIHTSGGVIVSKGSLKIEAAYGSGIDADGNVTISGGSVDIDAGDGIGIYSCGNVTIGGKLKIISNHSGIYLENNFVVNSGADINIKSEGAGIFNANRVAINGGKGVIESIGDPDEDWAVAVDNSGSIVVGSGVQVKGPGGVAAKVALCNDSFDDWLTFANAGGDPLQYIQFGSSGGASGGAKNHPVWTLNDKEDVTAPQGPAPMKPNHVAGAEVDAVKTSNPLILDGEQVDFPAVKIDGWNWLKLRDLAMLLNGTSKQFSIGYDASTNTIIITTGGEYEPLGDELMDMLTGDFTALASGQKIMFNGKLIEVAAYNIDGYNYFRLRDLMILLNVLVIYDPATGEVTLDLGKPYSE